jgi:serine/threonine protein kinase
MLSEPAAAPESTSIRRGFEDGLGRRYRPAARLESDTPLEILCFRHDLTDVPAFEFALRERVARLTDFHHPSFVRIRKVDRLNDERGTVTLMADAAAGDRLIEILRDVERTGQLLDLRSALHLVRQLVSAIAALHQHVRVPHGALAPERLFVTPRGRLLIVEYPIGAAIEQLKYSRERYWKDLRVALPMEAGRSRVDERADLTQIGTVALALVLARPLQDNEYPQQVEALVSSAKAQGPDGTRESLPSAVRDWLLRTLQLDARNAFRTVSDAQAALDQVLSAHPKYSAGTESLETFMQRYHGVVPASPLPVQSSAPLDTSPAVTAMPVRPVLAADESDEPYESYESYETYEPLPLPEAHSSEMSDEGAYEPDDQEDAMKPAYRSNRRSGRLKWIVAGAGLLAVTGGALVATRHQLSPAVPQVVTGTMTVNTEPPGAEVEVDGTARGRSPLSLALAPGAHTLVVRANGESRTVPITIAAGAEVSQYLDLPKAGSGFGQLQVRTEPAGARISIDGTPVGKTPMTIIEIAPGEHTITLENDLGTVQQKVMIEAGVPASLVVPMGTPPGAVASGWISVNTPMAVDLEENGRLLGNSSIDKIMLPAGRHEIELVNDHVGYRERRTVQVVPGRTATINVTLPKGTVSLNAIPWASVSIDGESIGDTPIGNFPLTIGPHEVVFRNAELGEQRRVITVTTGSPVRLSVDLTKK